MCHHCMAVMGLHTPRKHYTVNDKPGKETLDSRCLESQRALPILMPQNDRLSHLQSKSHVKSSHRGRNL